ncbi:MAG: Stp1/IreP family PP2C-type Ser/Thr phosphatase [Acidobacteriota bacterium]
MPDHWSVAWNVDAGCFSDVGRVRQRNEDSARISARPALYAVADGMGGHRAGDRASRIAVESLLDYLNRASGSSAGPAEDLFRQAFQCSNRNIIEDAAGHPDRLGMGTTLTALVLSGRQYWIGHIGDSRAFLIRLDAVEQLTDDHSIVAAQVREGGMTAEEAKAHPMRHVLSRCLGVELEPQVDVLQGEVEDGDVFVLASDGLTSVLAAEDIAASVRTASDAASASRALVEEACSRDGSDNITAVVVACHSQ